MTAFEYSEKRKMVFHITTGSQEFECVSHIFFTTTRHNLWNIVFLFLTLLEIASFFKVGFFPTERLLMQTNSRQFVEAGLNFLQEFKSKLLVFESACILKTCACVQVKRGNMNSHHLLHCYHTGLNISSGVL